MHGKFKPTKKPVKLSDLKTRKKSRLDTIIKRLEQQDESQTENERIKEDIDLNLLLLQKIFQDCSDIKFHAFSISTQKIKCLLVYSEGLIDKKTVNDNILHTLTTDLRLTQLDGDIEKSGLSQLIKDTIISVGEVSTVTQMKDAVNGVLTARCLVLADGNDVGLAIETKGFETRGVSDPKLEPLLRGPQEGLVENLKTNISMLRRRIKTPKLKMERFEIGRISKTEVILAYISGIAEEKLIDEIKLRLNRIDIDVCFESSYIEQLVEDNPLSPFPLLDITERPDGCAIALSEGRAVIIVDGTPFALLAPTVLLNMMSSYEDYYVRTYIAPLSKLLRFLTLFISLFGPSLYIAITTFHQEMIPQSLLITIAGARAEVPFPAIMEALIMEVTFEIIREASERSPRYLVQTVGLLGALVIGQTAVQAGLVSQAMLIVVAITGIASFTIPKFHLSRAIRLLRFPLMFLAGFFGIFGLIMGILALLVHLASLRSFGVPYLSPISPVDINAWGELVVKMPKWLIIKRPAFIQDNNIKRAKKGLRPRPPKKD